MTNNRPAYGNNVGPQGPQAPHTPVQPPTKRRVRTNVLVPNAIFPDWLSKYAVITYVLALMLVSYLYSNYMIPWYYMLSGVVAIMVFFIYGSNVAKRTSVVKMHSAKSFERRIFLIAFIPRLIYTILIYWIFMSNYGDVLGFENGDAFFYLQQGEEFADAILNGTFKEVWNDTTKVVDISDMGYVTYVGFVYWLTGKSVVALRLLKCILSAWTVLLIYRLAKRNFGEQTARVAAIFCALWPNFWYYCTTHLKETEMVFLTVLFVEQADQMLRSRKFSAWKMVPVLLIAAVLFTFRAPLSLVLLISLVFSIIMSSTKVITWGKRITVGLLAIALIGIVAGNRIQEKGRELIENQEKLQESGYKWYGERKDASGNQQRFAQYAGTAVFAPLILTLPFPSMIRAFEGQEQQQLQNGGNFVKNILSFFTIFALLALALSGRWRDHLLPLSFMIGYVVVLALSSFAHSERFHQPAMPFEFMFAAYGLSLVITKLKYKRWFACWSVAMFVVAIGWNWFKLKGRGLI